MSAFAERLAAVQAEIAAACARADRDPAGVELIGVSKTHPAETLIEAAAAGIRQFGENRVDEAAAKVPTVTAAAGDGLAWHMVGHLQSRKARDAAALFNVIHSVDTIRLAGKLAEAVPAGRRLQVLLEVNVSGEASKAGFAAAAWEADPAQRAALAEAVRAVAALPALQLSGLMTMAPIVPDMEDARPVFRRLRLLRDWLQEATDYPLPALSMGMTDDYPVAIEEGATLVRIGRALFGERLARG